MNKNLKNGSRSDSVTFSTALLNQRLAISNAPRMLTRSEIELLRKSKQEIAARYKASRVESEEP
nr:hypothetical protein [Chromatiaceae bacterium]